MTKLFTLLTFIAFFHSCSVKKDQKPDIRVLDSDGDQMMDEEELNLGRNLWVSNFWSSDTWNLKKTLAIGFPLKMT